MKEAAYAFAGFALLVVLYLGAYCAMVTPNSMTFDADGLAKPDYRVRGTAVETLFFPMFALDRQIRPERWPLMPAPAIGIDVL